METATRLSDFRAKVQALHEEWLREFASQATTPRPRPITGWQRSIRTPEGAYRRPILEALSELGGRAPMAKVLDRVETKMKGRLNKYDYELLPSTRQIRWQNSAQWCRYNLVRERLMKADSPRGIWEISERGREALRLGQV